MVNIGTPLTANATRLLLLDPGELGKEIAIEAQRFDVEVIAVDRYAHAPAMQVAHRSHVINILGHGTGNLDLPGFVRIHAARACNPRHADPRNQSTLPVASAMNLPHGDSDSLLFENLDTALMETDTMLRLFGKLQIRGHRRVGMTLTRVDSSDSARDKAKCAATVVKVHMH